MAKTNHRLEGVRIAYPWLFKPRVNELKGGVEEYAAVFLIPKEPCSFNSDPKATLASLNQVIKDLVAEDLKGKKGLRNPVKDGDEETNEKTGQPKFPGYWFIQATCLVEWPPVVVGPNAKPLTEQFGWKSGDWGNADIRLYTYDKAGNAGIGVGLNAVQFSHVDEPIGTVRTPDAVAATFSVIPGGVNPAPSATAVVEDPAFDPFSDD